jgi:ribose transport system substrate-binding protein
MSVFQFGSPRGRRGSVVACVAGALALAVGLAACGGDDNGGSGGSSGGGSATSANTSKIRIAQLGYNGSPYGIATKNGAADAAKQLGVEVTWFDANNDPKAQYTQLQDAITTGKYQGIWLWALDGHGIQPLVKNAIAKGIKVAIADYTLGDSDAQVKLSATPGTVTTVGQSIGDEGTNEIAIIKKACAAKVGEGKPCNVAFMPGLDNYPTDVYRIKVLKKGFATGPITFKLMPQGDYDQASAQKVALTYFQSKPKVDVFATFGDQMLAGVLVALKQEGITPGKDILTIGYGGTKEVLDQIKSGAVYATLGLYPYRTSQTGMKLLVDALRGKQVPSLVNILAQPGSPAILDADFLKANPSYKPDWALSG